MIDQGPFNLGKDCVGLQHKDEEVKHDSPNKQNQEIRKLIFLHSSEVNALLVLFFIDLIAGTHMQVLGTDAIWSDMQQAVRI